MVILSVVKEIDSKAVELEQITIGGIYVFVDKGKLDNCAHPIECTQSSNDFDAIKSITSFGG